MENWKNILVHFNLIQYLQEASNTVAYEIWETDKAVAEIDNKIDALKRPWHEAGSTEACGSFYRLLLTQRFTKCVPLSHQAYAHACIAMSAAFHAGPTSSLSAVASQSQRPANF